MRHDHRFIWFDFIRGVCAIAVCAGHLRGVAIVDYSSLGATSHLQKVFYLSTGMGHQAVMVFFVLSGFFVGGAVLKNRMQFDPLRYATARLTRLWIVLIPALLVTAAVDMVLKIYAPDVLSGAYRSAWNSGPGADLSYSSSVQTFIANVFFLQTITAPVFGTNGPLWSLSNEFWYYVLFPIIVLAIQGCTRAGRLCAIQRWICGLSGLALAAWLPLDMTEGFLIWGMGLGVYAISGKISAKWNVALVAIGVVLFAASLGYSKSHALQRYIGAPSDFVVGAAFCLFAIGLVNSKTHISMPNWFGNFAKCISDFSFSLYLVHFPIVALIGALFYQDAQLQPDAIGLAYFGLWLMPLLACGYIFYAAFERQTDALRRRIERMLPVQTQRA